MLNMCQTRLEGLTVRGHTIHLKRDSASARNQDEITVSTRPPKNPSHVFFGDSFISGVRPKKNPAYHMWHTSVNSPLISELIHMNFVIQRARIVLQHY